MKKLFTLLTMLIVVIGTSWGAITATHTPGTYESSTGYNTKLTTYSERDYEVYYFTWKNSKGYIAAGSSYNNNSSAYCIMSDVSTGSHDFVGNWGNFNFSATGGNSSTSSPDEWGVSSNKTTHSIPLNSSSTFTIKISGYDQFSFLGRDDSNTSNQFIVTIDGVQQTFTHSTSDNTAFRFDITTEEHTIVVTAGSTTALRFRGFSLRLPSTPATPYKVTFDAGDHGTYTGGDITEASAGAGVTLPALTTLADGYIFNGWYTASTGGTKAGDAGDNYKPSADNTPLYAQYSEIPTPTFVLSASSIEVGQTAQIKVTGKDDLDGVTLSDISYGTSGVVTVNATTGVVTPVAAGNTTITFNSSAVDGKYKASSGNLSITVTAPTCVAPVITPTTFATDNQAITMSTETADATIYYTTNGTTPTTESSVYDSENKPTISSTTTFKAIAVKDGYDNSTVTTQKVTRTASALVGNWDFTSWSSATQTGVKGDTEAWSQYEKTNSGGMNFGENGRSNVSAISSGSTLKYSTTNIEETDGLTFAAGDYGLGLIFNIGSATVSSTEYTYQGSSYLWLYNKNAVITIPSVPAGATIEIGVESHNGGAARGVTLKNGSTSLTQTQGEATSKTYQVCKWTNATAGNVTVTPSAGLHIYYIKVTGNAETVPVATVGSNNYATYVTENNLDFSTVSDEITAYIATGDNGTTITTEAVTEVPAGTALLIKTADAGATVNVPVAASTPTALTANKLKYSSESLVISNDAATAKRYYGFFKVGGKYGFAPMKAGTLAAKKAYLDYGEQGNSLQFIALDFDDAPTAIDAVEAANANNVAPVKVIKNGKLYIGNYNVAGQQVK